LRRECKICGQTAEITTLKVERDKYRSSAQENVKLRQEITRLEELRQSECKFNNKLILEKHNLKAEITRLKTELSFMKTGINGIINHQYSESWADARKQMIEDLSALIDEKQ
jgi:hypothetical protein